MNESGMQHAICIILYRGTYTGLGSHSSSTDALMVGVVVRVSGAQARDSDTTLSLLTDYPILPAIH